MISSGHATASSSACSAGHEPGGQSGLPNSSRVAVTVADSGFHAAIVPSQPGISSGATYLRGAAQNVVDRAQSESDAAWWAAREPFWEEYFDPRRFPGITHVFEDGGFERREDEFEFGLARVLDGIAAYLARDPDLPPSKT